MTTVVVALGGNALLRRGEPMDPETQDKNVAAAAAALAPIADEHRLVVTHGNGPQVGLLALQSYAYGDAPPFPLDVLGAETEGMIGYQIDHHLLNVLPHRDVATVLTQVEVVADDPAFSVPTKPIGPVYERSVAQRLAAARGWTIAPDGDGYRRVVPSPAPHRIVELHAIRLLLDAGVVVICAGGGGIPVMRGRLGLVGVEAVVDKDASSALLAESLDADVLALLTDVDAVYDGWGTPDAVALHRVTPARLRAVDAAAGSMGPKIAAACGFVERTGGRAVIAALDDAEAAVAGETGTVIAAD